MAEGAPDLMLGAGLSLALFGSFADAFHFIVHSQNARLGDLQVGGLSQVADFAWEQLKLTAYALGISLAIALPAGIVLGYKGKGEVLAVALGNAGRAIPELALIAFLVAFIGVGVLNVTIALAVLGIPPILTNTFVGMRQVDRGSIDAARGMGMTAKEIITKVQLPLAVPTVMAGVRTSATNIVATATIAPLAGVQTLGSFILNRNVYGDEGVLAGAILVALLALTIELALAGLQWLLTPSGLRLSAA